MQESGFRVLYKSQLAEREEDEEKQLLLKFKSDYIELSHSITLLYVKHTKDMDVFDGIGSNMSDPHEILNLIRK